MKQMPSAYNKKRILSLWLCLTLLLTVLLPVSAFAAVSGKKVVRVGWFESTFNMTDLPMSISRRLPPIQGGSTST